MEVDVVSVDQVVDQIVQELLERAGHVPRVTDATDLSGAGLSSPDGVELACDLEARLGVRIPPEVNPLVTDDGRRFRTLGELKDWARRFREAHHRRSDGGNP